MRRRIVWRYGDSPPVFGNMVAAVEGDGELRVYTGFPVSSAQVGFSKIYNRWEIEQYGYGYAFGPEVYVSELHDDGFTLCYKNIVDALNVNYLAM